MKDKTRMNNDRKTRGKLKTVIKGNFEKKEKKRKKKKVVWVLSMLSSERERLAKSSGFYWLHNGYAVLVLVVLE